MSDFFNDSINYLAETKKQVSAINIGAMDGVMFDELNNYKQKYNIKTLYVEPIPYLFEKLKDNIGDNGFDLFENSAISEYNGEIEMMTIDREAIDSGKVHSCFYGMSAVYPPKNGLGSEGDRETVEKYGKIVKVKCITFNDLITKHNFSDFDIVKIDTEGHDYKIFSQIDLKLFRPSVIRVEWINLSDEEKIDFKKILKEHNYRFTFSSQDIVAIKNELYTKLYGVYENSGNVTLVTGLWDLGRDKLNGNWSRDFEGHYLNKLKEFLEIPENLIIFGDEKVEKFVIENKTHNNVQFIRRDLNWFKQQFFEKIQKIRTDEKWYNQRGWLSESTQAKLEMYNPIVMQKMFLLNDANLMSKFKDEHIFWLDAGITNTVHKGYFTHDKVFDKIQKYFNKFSFICFPYEADGEIHGFDYEEICNISEHEVKKVARGGFFGGPVECLSEAMDIYYNLLDETLSKGLMGTEESVFSIMVYKYGNIFNHFEIESNGLIGKFFEDLKEDRLKLKSVVNKKEINKNPFNLKKVALYIITFNSPEQVRTLIKSFKSYDTDFINSTNIYLLNNSTDLSTDDEYNKICEEYSMTQLRFEDNLGICGGRQYIAEHFDKTEDEYMFFFEDDMFFYNGEEDKCKNGFVRYVKNIFKKSLNIVHNESYDFLKLSFTEFYGDNSTQWAWYNVPQNFREKHWPKNKRLPSRGLDRNAPSVKYNNIKTYDGLSYADGEIYYCNWPQVVSKEGNRKMFLTEKWAHPFEQTWMSYIFQETIKGNIKPSLLMSSPIEHDRFEHYDKELRKES